ncbi:MAG: Asp23/Gls24 family envelope stress response protein [Opitutales bacterium]|nr:Asp23/Gls24 family envelope stress response protein [Opitutales bacterium]|tara:strand:- start:2533 stop:2991 length:459 start_codon:yes stop_codon:yes gene_type:complete
MSPRKKAEAAGDQEIPTITEETTSLGDIKINHSVVASIVRLATMEVEGVFAVGGGGVVEGIAEFLSKKESERGVTVADSDGGAYDIEVRVILRFGVDLAKVGMQIQETVRDRVVDMTSKPVERIDVVIDGIKMDPSDQSSGPAEGWEEVSTD